MPFLALVLFLLAASQVAVVGGILASLGWAALVFGLYLVIAPLLAKVVARLFALDTSASRTLAFNIGTRNSFVVLPLALALPPAYEAAVPVIVLQTVVELSGVIAYLWLVPKRLFPTSVFSR